MADATRVRPMHKVSLSIAVSGDGAHDAPPDPLPFTLIYGIGVEGLCAFEKALYDKSIGDTLSVDVDAQTMPAVFGHLVCAMMEAVPVSAPTRLRITIDAIAPVTDRELVRALAQGSGSCSGGDCDCGCGC